MGCDLRHLTCVLPAALLGRAVLQGSNLHLKNKVRDACMLRA